MAAPICRGLLYALALSIVLQNNGVAASEQRNPSQRDEPSNPLCEGISCENNGKCKVVGSSAECVCPSGYTGEKCQN
ncbi:meprin a subunit, partial [Plakobranchus ocellatus]